MFGYIKPYTPELKVREHELYRAIYCGLCRSMGRVTGQVSRFTLNYDFVFLVAVRLLAQGSVPEISKKTCIAHPVKKRAYIHDCEELRYAARVAAALTFGKIEDDIADERGLRRMKALAFHPGALAMTKKAARGESSHETSLRGSVGASLAALSSIESRGGNSLDECAEAFGALCADAFASGLPEKQARIAREVGRGVGRFIYVCDACDDVIEDSMKGRFNAILALYGDSALVEKNGVSYLSDAVADSLLTATRLDLERCAAAAELLCDEGDRTLAAIVRNVIYLGMPETLNNILKKRCAPPEA